MLSMLTHAVGLGVLAAEHGEHARPRDRFCRVDLEGAGGRGRHPPEVRADLAEEVHVGPDPPRRSPARARGRLSCA
jgi:hypothetical protein